MPQTKRDRPHALVVTAAKARDPGPAADSSEGERRGFGGGVGRPSRRKGGKKRTLDRGGRHDTMQPVNGARDLLLGRGLAGGSRASRSPDPD